MVSTQQYNDKNWRSSGGRGQHYCSFEMFLSFSTAQSLTLTPLPPPLLLDNQLELSKFGKKKFAKTNKMASVVKNNNRKRPTVKFGWAWELQNFYKVFARLNMPLYSKFFNWGKQVLVTCKIMDYFDKTAIEFAFRMIWRMMHNFSVPTRKGIRYMGVNTYLICDSPR